MSPGELRTVVAGAVVCEIGWRARDGAVGAAARTPLLYDAEAGGPVLALTYDDSELAGALARADSAALVVSDARLVLRGWQPLTAVGRPRVQEDPDGEVFIDRLLDQELRKHPPSRLRADSLLQRSEHWWYLPRLLVRFDDLRTLGEPAARSVPDEGVLVWDAGAGLRADTVAVDDWAADRVRVRSLTGVGAEPRGAGPAALLRHEFSDDFERRAELSLSGTLDGDTVTVQSRSGRAELPSLPSWWQRLRAAKRLERECRRGIVAAGH